MDKRHFMSAAALAVVTLPAARAAKPAADQAGPTLLTVTGAIARANRGPFDKITDRMMHKQKLEFDKAFVFDFAALTRLPALEIAPTIEYDGKTHALKGPLLLDVLKAAGATLGEGTSLLLRAVDGYAVNLALSQARAQRYIVATHLDGKPLALGGLGPLWAVYDADRVPEMAAKPVKERFGTCPWALYHIDVTA